MDVLHDTHTPLSDEEQISDSKMIEEAIINANLSNEEASIWRAIVEEEFSRIKNIAKHQEILQTFNGKRIFGFSISFSINFTLERSSLSTAHPWVSPDQMTPFDWSSQSPSKETLSSKTFTYLWKNNLYLTSGKVFILVSA